MQESKKPSNKPHSSFLSDDDMSAENNQSLNTSLESTSKNTEIEDSSDDDMSAENNQSLNTSLKSTSKNTEIEDSSDDDMSAESNQSLNTSLESTSKNTEIEDSSDDFAGLNHSKNMIVKKSFTGIPKFGGLSMLLSSPKDLDKKNPSPTNDLLLPEKQKESQINAGKSSLSEQNQVFSNNNNKANEDGYDSASSANTDEILLSYKVQKQHSTQPTLKEDSTNKVLPKERCSVLDKKLQLLAGVNPDIEKGNMNSITSVECCDSDDSELDSNDFKLVAKRLEQKAANKSKNKDKSKNKKTEVEVVQKTSKIQLEHQSSPTDTKCTSKSSNCEENEKKAKSDPLTVNEKRLQAVKEKLKMKQQQYNIMKKALDNIDSQKNNNRKVFSSDDEDDDNIEDENEKKGSSKDRKKAVKTEKKDSKKELTLFENSDTSDEEADYTDMFKSHPHFEGKKGEKLMKLERKIGDSRFKIDAKFADSDSEEELDEDEGVQTNELAAERDASLKVLEKVVGKSTLDKFTSKIKRNTKTIVDMNTVRFDPTKMLPVKPVQKQKVEKEPQSSDTPDKRETKTDEVTEPVAIKSDTVKSNVVVSSSLVDLFKKENDQEGGFSLLSQFDDSVSPSADNNIISKKIDIQEESFDQDISFKDGDVDYDSDDDETDEDDDAHEDSEEEETDEDINEQEKGNLKDKEKSNKIPEVKTAKTDPDSLFKTGSDSEDIDMAESSQSENEDSTIPEGTDVRHNFSKELWNAGRVDIRYTKEKWIERWEEIRPILVKIYKRKHKDAVKKKRIHSEHKRRKEFSKSSKRNSWYRKK